MDRIKVPAGSNQSIEAVFDSLQDFNKSNLTIRTNSLFSSFGTINSTKSEGSITITDNLRVTLATSPGNMTRIMINEGKALVTNQEMIYVNTAEIVSLADIVNNSNDTFEGDTFYLIKLRWVLTGNEPIPAQAGFRFDPFGVTAYSHKYAKFLDDFMVTYSKVTDVVSYVNNIRTDEVALAIVKSNSLQELDSTSWQFQGRTAVNGVVDLRDLFALKLSVNLFDDALIVLKDRNSIGEQRINGALEAKDGFYSNQYYVYPSGGTTPYWSITGSDTLDINTLHQYAHINFHNINTSPLLYLNTTLHKVGINKVPNPSSIYTLEVNGKSLFDSDVDIIGNLNIANSLTVNGRGVVLEPVANSGIAPSILNFHVSSIKGNGATPSYDPAVVDIMSNEIHNGGYDGNVTLTLKWNHDEVTGTGGINEFNAFITHSGTYAQDALKGYFLKIPHTNEDLLITGNEAESFGSIKIYVRPIDAETWNGIGVSITSLSPAWIHSRADRYELAVIPYRNNQPDISAIETVDVKRPTYTSNLSASVRVAAGSRYIFQIRAVRGQTWSTIEATNWVTLPSSGSYLVLHPDISSTNASLSLASTRNGFSASIAGWNDAEKYELIWSSLSTPDFSSDTVQRMITSSRELDIKTAYPATYQVKARPLIGGQQVANPLSGSVVSGGDGSLPQDQVLINFDFDVRQITAVGTVGGVTSDTYLLTCSSLKGPNNLDITMLPSSLYGKQIVDDLGTHCTILEQPTSTTILMKGDIPPLGTTFKTAMTKSSRLMFRSISFPIDYELTGMSITVLTINSPVHVRVYQQGVNGENMNDSLTITQPGTYLLELDIRLMALFGNRTLIVDAWDDSIAPANDGSFNGTATIYGRPKPDPRSIDLVIAGGISSNTASTSQNNNQYSNI